jgi:hypothetical protein
VEAKSERLMDVIRMVLIDFLSPYHCRVCLR